MAHEMQTGFGIFGFRGFGFWVGKARNGLPENLNPPIISSFPDAL